MDDWSPSTPEEWIEFALEAETSGYEAKQSRHRPGAGKGQARPIRISHDSEEIRDIISEALRELPFPTPSEVWKDSTIVLLLERFRLFFDRVPPKLVGHKVDEGGRQLGYISTALQALDHLGYGSMEQGEQENNQAGPSQKPKRERKLRGHALISFAARLRQSTNAIDPRVFDVVGVAFPTTFEQARDARSALVRRLQELLEAFLEALANPELPEHASAAFIKRLSDFPSLKSILATIIEPSTSGGLDDTEPIIPFQLSAEQKEVIYYDSACCVVGRSGSGKTTCIVAKILGNQMLFESKGEAIKPRQVYVTQSRLTAQRVQEYYERLACAGFGKQELRSDNAYDEEQVPADLEDEDASEFGLPPKYSMLEDHHFPLFLSFDQLYSLLEADLQTLPGQNGEGIKGERRAMVTFDAFLSEYWPRFNQHINKGIDPALAYSEFLATIEGSESTVGTKCGALLRGEYVSGSHGGFASASERDRIYTLYEAYLKLKVQFGDYDVADRVHALIRATNSRIPGRKIDFLYIDEAQENLLIDFKFMRNLSADPRRILIGGNPAEAFLSVGCFRFEDFRSSVWRIEEGDELGCDKQHDATRPKLFHLAINYKSNGGITNCASSVIQVISGLFPASIDKLKQEIGLVDGPRPLFFTGWEHDKVLFGPVSCTGSPIKVDFGRSQAIIVRNDASRTALRERRGEMGLILTVYESKGLEFDDVLLYNFFEYSVLCASTWRIALNDIRTTQHSDERHYSLICSELKCLYFGLTRARENCWIWDMSEKSEPMKTFWAERDLVSLCGPQDIVPQLGGLDSRDSWAQRGRSLFNKQLYSQAAICFGQAELMVERDIAAAYQSRKQARALQAATSTNHAVQTFLSTATAFMGCAERSAREQQLTCYMRAAECFVESGAWKSAAGAFLQAGELCLAAKNYLRAGRPDEAVHVVEPHRGQTGEGVAGGVIEVAKPEYLQTHHSERAETPFENVEGQLGYTGDFGFNVSRAYLLETEQRYGEVAEVAFGGHKIMEGLLLLLLSDNPEHRRQADKRALHSLWILLPFGPQGDKLNNTNIVPLIRHLKRAKGVLDDDEIRQLEVFEAIHGQDPVRLSALAQSNGVTECQSEAHLLPTLASILSLLCFSYSSDILIPALDWTIQDFIGKWELAFSYFIQLLRLGQNLDISSQHTQKLLGFEPRKPTVVRGAEDTGTAATEFWVHSTSRVFDSARNTPGAHDSILSDLGPSLLAISRVNASCLARTQVYDALRFETQKIALSSAVDYSVYLEPCIEYAVFGICERDACRKQHVHSHELSDDHRQKEFNSRAQALILQLEIVHIYPPRDVTDSRVVRRTWCRQAYGLLMPYFPPLGGLLCLHRTCTSEKDQGWRLLSAWCEDALQYIDPKYGTTALSDILINLELASRIDGPSTNFTAYADRLHSTRLVNPLPGLMWRSPVHPHPQHSIVHDLIDFYARRSDTALARMVQAMHHIVINQLAIEANVLVQVLEFIGREAIVHYRLCTYGPQVEEEVLLDQMLIPRSWAVDIITRPRLTSQKPFILAQFMDTLCKAIEILHTHKLGKSRVLLRFGDPLNLLTRTVLIMRICRILILVAVNINLAPPERELMRDQVGSILKRPGILHALCARFARSNTWIDFQDALVWSPLNRGADELVFLWLRGDSGSPPFSDGTRSIIYSNVFPELAKALSLNGTTEQPEPGPQLNPSAKAFVTSAAMREASKQPQAGSYPNALSALAPSEDDTPETASDFDPWCTLTAKEIRMGKTILQCYREYTARQKIKVQIAGRIIWAYYRRHHLRHLAHQTATGEMIRKLHVDYMREVERLVYPPLLLKRFYQHKRVLLGCMPHAMIYLRGLEEVNQHELVTKKQQLLVANYDDLEKLQSRINACGKFAKKIKALIRDLSPGSSLLKHLDSLQHRVRRAADARQSVMRAFDKDSIPADLDHHYLLGVEMIPAPGATPATIQPRPGSQS